MANGNGTFKIIGYIGGAVVFLLTLYTVFHVPILEAITREAEARAESDKRIEDKVDMKLEKILLKMDAAQAQQSEITMRLIRMETKLENGR